MGNTNQDVEIEVKALDARLVEEEAKVTKHKALQKLFDRDTEAGEAFATIILDGYGKEEADRITKSIITPDGMKREHIETSIDKLKGIRHLNAYLARIEMDAMYADETIKELKFAKDDIKVNPSKYVDTEG